MTHRVHFIAALLLLTGTVAAHAQDPPPAQSSSTTEQQHPVVPEPPRYAYQAPTEGMKLRNYLFDAFGPYPLAMSAVISGYHQARRTPPDWREGLPGYAERYASDFGTSAAAVTGRYLAAEVLREDTMYYRCDCTRAWPRLQHAFMSTFIARREDNGNFVFSVPGVIQPYAGSFTAVYGWFPSRYDAKDALRMGTYGLLDAAVGNISIEFLPALFNPGAGSRISRWHLDNRHAARKNESAP